MWCCSEVDHYPESSKVGGVVAETPQETVWRVSFRAAVGAPVIPFIIPENAGKLVQRRPINHLQRQMIETRVGVNLTWSGLVLTCQWP